MNPCGRISAQAGFSLVELGIVTLVLSLVVIATFGVMQFGLETENTGSTLIEIQGMARRVLDGIAKDLQNAVLTTISPTPPAAGQAGTHTITFSPCAGYSGGSLQYGSVTTIAFAYETGESNNGQDDNSNKLVDEGVVAKTVGGTTQTLVHWVKEDGLSFNLDGHLLTVTLELERRNAKGDMLQASLATSIQIRN